MIQRGNQSIPSGNNHLQSPKNTFAFLEKEEEGRPSTFSPFFSENGLSQDIITVTNAEPDICLEVFYALYNTLCPQIEKQSDISLKDAWTEFIGGSMIRGILWPPEKLIQERRLIDVKATLSKGQGKEKMFEKLNKVVDSIGNLKKKIIDSPYEILQKEDVLVSLNLVQDIYLEFKRKILELDGIIREKHQKNISSNIQCDELENLLEPKAVMISEVFKNHWAYRIPREKARRILSKELDGQNVKNDSGDGSNHRVIPLPEETEPLVYFKANGNPAIQPEKEFMLYSLYRHLQIPVPETALLLLSDVFETNCDDTFAVQASEAVAGEQPLKAGRYSEGVFEEKSYFSQVMGALLTNPSDGSFKNFKFNPTYQTIISIDNDLVFKSEFSGRDGKTVNVKSALYVFSLMDRVIPESIKTLFMTLDPQLTILAWLKDLVRKNAEYRLLFTRLSAQNARLVYHRLPPQSSTPLLKACVERKVLIDRDLEADLFFPEVLISKDLLSSILEKLNKIQETFAANHSADAQLLFEKVSPVLGKYYQKLRSKFNDPQIALEALWGEKKNGVDYSHLSSLLTSEELNNFSQNMLNEDTKLLIRPEELLEWCKGGLNCGQTPLDRLIRRHGERRMKKTLNLQEVVKDLQLLIDEGCTDSKAIKEVATFYYNISKEAENQNLIKEIKGLICSLPHAELKWFFILEQYFLRLDPKDSRGLSPVVTGAFMNERIFLLSESEKQCLFDQEGYLKKNPSLSEESNGTCFPETEPRFYLKQHPEFPGYRFASSLFMRLVGINHLPYQDLLIMKCNSERDSYPLLLTQKVDGKPVREMWNEAYAFSNLDPFHTGLLIISSMLLNPKNGKEDNYILSEDGKYLIPVNNEHCFLPSSFQKEGNFWNGFTVNTALQTKTVLFCLEEMNKRIPDEVRNHFLSINLDALLKNWMLELVKVEERYNTLVDEKQLMKFRERGTVMGIPFEKQFIENLHWKVHKIQFLFSNTKELTPFDLLKAIEPFAARCYQDSFHKGSTVKNRFKAAINGLQAKAAPDGSRISILNPQTFIEITHVPKNDTNTLDKKGPVDAQEYLNQLAQEKKGQIEQELLSELDEESQERILFKLFGTSVDASVLQRFFTNSKDPFANSKEAFVKEAFALIGCKLITDTKLKELLGQTPNKGAKLKYLSFPKSSLTHKAIRVLVEECPSLEYLNISGCIKLKEIIINEGEWPQLARLEAQDCSSLEKLICWSPLKVLRVSTLCKAEIFLERYEPDMFSIVVDTNLFSISLEKKSFKIKSRKKLLSNHDVVFPDDNKERDFEESKIKIKIGNFLLLSLKDLGVFVHVLDLTGLNISLDKLQRMVDLPLLNLQSLHLSDAKIKNQNHEVVQSKQKQMNVKTSEKTLVQGFSILSDGNWPLLELLDLKNTGLTSKGIKELVHKSKWPELKFLDLSYNALFDEGLSVLLNGNWPLLETLDLRNTHITEKGFVSFVLSRSWQKLRKILSDFSIETDDPAVNLLLVEELDFSKREVTSAQIEILVMKFKFPKLKYLDLSNNKILDEGVSILSKGYWPELEKLHLRDINLTSKGIEEIVNKFKWPKLKDIDLSNNKIDDEGLPILSRGCWPVLKDLTLKKTNVTKKGLVNFALSVHWQSLEKINSDFLISRSLLPKNCSSEKSLDLSSYEITSVEIDLLVKRRKMTELTKLNLSKNEISDQGFSILVRGEWPLLEKLELDNTKLTLKGIEEIVDKSKWPKLKDIDLSNNEICDKGLSILSRGNWLLLETLTLENIKSTNKGLINFTSYITWHNLKKIVSNIPYLNYALPINWALIQHLDLSSKGILPVEIDLIVNRMKWTNMKKLILSNNEISEEGFSMLALGQWPLLETLKLDKTKLTSKGVEEIVNKSKWHQLKCLDLSDNAIYDQGLSFLSRRNWPLLETLNLRNTNISENGFVYFVLSGNWPNPWGIRSDFSTSLHVFDSSLFEKLDLNNGGVTPAQIKIIVKKFKLPKLKYLDLSNSQIYDEDLSILSKANWPLLEIMNLKNTNLTEKGFMNFVLRLNWQNLREIRSDFSVDINNLLVANSTSVKALDLNNKGMMTTDIEAIINKFKWPQLMSLNLSHNGIYDDGLSILLRGDWKLLEKLQLVSTGVTFQGLRMLVDQSRSLQLKHLDLSQNAIYDEGLSTLWRGNWPELETLVIKEIKSTKKGLIVFTLNVNWENLKNIICDFDFLSSLLPINCETVKSLDLSSSGITSVEIDLLVKRKMTELTALDLSDNEISSEEFSILALGEWPLLQILKLDNTKLTRKVTEQIVNKSRWPELKHLNLSQNEINNDSEEELEILSRHNWSRLEPLILKESKPTKQ